MEAQKLLLQFGIKFALVNTKKLLNFTQRLPTALKVISHFSTFKQPKAKIVWDNFVNTWGDLEKLCKILPYKITHFKLFLQHWQ